MPQAALLNRRHRFTAEEDEALRKWVAKHPGCKPQGHHLWQVAEHAGITVHPWQSMRERWRKKVEPRQPLRPAGLRSPWLGKGASKKRKFEEQLPSLLHAPASSSEFLPKRHKASGHLVVHEGEDGLMTNVEVTRVVPENPRAPMGRASSSRRGVVVSRGLPKAPRRVGSLLLQATQAAAARSRAMRPQWILSPAATASDVVPPSDPIRSLFEDTGSDLIQSASLNPPANMAASGTEPARKVEESPPAAVEKAANDSSGSDTKPDVAERSPDSTALPPSISTANAGSKRWRSIRVDENSTRQALADMLSTQANPQEPEQSHPPMNRPPLPPPAETPSQQTASVGASAEIPAAQPYTQTCDTEMPGSQTLAMRLEENFLPYQGETMTYRTDVRESQHVDSNAALEEPSWTPASIELQQDAPKFVASPFPRQPSMEGTMTFQSDLPEAPQSLHQVAEEMQTIAAQAAAETYEEPSQSDRLAPIEFVDSPLERQPSMEGISTCQPALPDDAFTSPRMTEEEQLSVAHASGRNCEEHDDGLAEVMESLLRQDEFVEDWDKHVDATFPETLALMMELGAASPLEIDLRAEVEHQPSPAVVIISSSSDKE